MVAFRFECNTESVTMSADGGPGRHGGGSPSFNVTVGAAGNPTQVSLFLLESTADAAMTYFYGQLFAMDTEIRAMFPAAMDVQRRRFFRALVGIAQDQDDPAVLVPYLEQLGRAHRKFGVREQHYGVFRRALLATLHRFAARAWDEETQRAWERAYDHAVDVMIDAADRDAHDAPAWWIGTVAATELRGPDMAVLTVAPEQPMTYRAGQHVSVQTPHWPRLWRRYSIANTPRPDGTLRLHVRAIAGGLVSAALVHHVRAGDPLVLGAPDGTMTANTDSPRDVLCLAGGTGLAPIKAIIEAIIHAPAPGRRREVVLYFGARRHQDLYDLAELQQMELVYPWLQVIPAVSDEPARDEVMYGTVPELAAKATWADRDIYVSGPDAMIAKTVQVLRERGAPRHLIHYDRGGLGD
jgi:NAD(P)H-flavin reductase/hemoglobin-like flavoprotein